MEDTNLTPKKKHRRKNIWMFFATLGLVLGPVLIYMAILGADLYLQNNAYTLFAIDDQSSGIGIWLGVWASYSGCVASCVVAWYANKASKAANLSQQSFEEAKKKTLSSLAQTGLAEVIANSLPNIVGAVDGTKPHQTVQMKVFSSDYYTFDLIKSFRYCEQLSPNAQEEISKQVREYVQQNLEGVVFIIRMERMYPYVSVTPEEQLKIYIYSGENRKYICTDQVKCWHIGQFVVFIATVSHEDYIELFNLYKHASLSPDIDIRAPIRFELIFYLNFVNLLFARSADSAMSIEVMLRISTKDIRRQSLIEDAKYSAIGND